MTSTTTATTGPATRAATSADGTRITFETLGSGPPLVVVWGALGARRSPFARQMREELARSFTVTDYDRRGRGESGDTKPYRVAREVEDLAAVIAAVGGDAYVFATSSGAALALEAAASGVPMRTLAAYEPPYMVGDPKDRPDADFERKLVSMIAEDRRDDAVKYFMRTVGVPAFFLFLMRLMPVWKDMRAVAHTLPYDAAVMAGFSLPEARLRDVAVPTVVLAGGATTPTLRAGAEAAARAIPGARFQVIPKQNHGVQPKALRPVLAELFHA
jgi:pimeloyl-ACP methyl ester carboxylesterase